MRGTVDTSNIDSLGRSTVVSFTHELSFLSFFLSLLFINPPCSAAAQWMAIKMHLGGSVVGKVSTIGIEISPTLP